VAKINKIGSSHVKLETGNRKALLFGSFLLACAVSGGQFTGPSEWRMVNTNAVEAWNSAQQKSVSPVVAAWPGVVSDKQKREVRLLAEAVGHPAGITTEFLLVGPLSDRAYESAAVTVAKPGDIVRAIEHLGVARGGCIASRPFRFWPYGERLVATMRRLDGAEKPLQSLIHDSEASAPLLGDGGLVFTGGHWNSAGECWGDTNMPSSVISLYNESSTILDVPFQVGQSEAYGRLTLAEAMPYGTLIEIVLRPLTSMPRVLPLVVTAAMQGLEVKLTCAEASGAVLKQAGLADSLTWMKSLSEQGRELFVTLDMDDAMPLKRATDVARVFEMLDGKGIKLDGKTASGLYPRAFLPQEKWRERKDRNPQPFELHVTQDASGKIVKKLVFIEEDWSVPGLDPKLTPREYPFENWSELSGLVAKTGGPDCKVSLLFVFAPAEMALAKFMPGVRAVSEQLPMVYLFGE